MDTRTKLLESKYFLDILPAMQNDPEKFYYNLSAFLTAWRSTLDVLLYDLAEHFSLGFTREDAMTAKEFNLAAKILENTVATEFILWWKKKQGILSNIPLWRKRNINFHRGRLKVTKSYRIYASGSGGTSITIPPSFFSSTDSSAYFSLGTLVPDPSKTSTTYLPKYTNHIELGEYYFDDLDESVIAICKTAYEKMVEIVEEAKKTFKVTV